MRAVIMAAGEGTRWGGHRGVPKHLVDVGGEPLLERTCRQLIARDAHPVIVAPPDPRYSVEGAYTVAPSFAQCDTDKFLTTVEWWLPDEPILIVYGDAYLTDECADALLSPGWVGRAGPSSVTGCPHGELFGVHVTPQRQGEMARAIVYVRGLLLQGRLSRGGGWEVYRAFAGLPLDEHQVGADFTDVDDLSEDFDTPEDYEQWLSAL